MDSLLIWHGLLTIAGAIWFGLDKLADAINNKTED